MKNKAKQKRKLRSRVPVPNRPGKVHLPAKGKGSYQRGKEKEWDLGAEKEEKCDSGKRNDRAGLSVQE